MIEFVEKMLLDAIDAADSDKVDQTFETEVIVDGAYLRGEIEDAVKTFLSGAAVTMPSDSDIRGAVSNAWKKKFTQTEYIKHFKNIGGNLLDVQFIAGKRTRILFRPGGFGKMPSGSAKNFNKILNIHKNTMGFLMGQVYKRIHKELKFKKGRSSPMSQTKFSKGMRKTKRFAGLHSGKDRTTTALGGTMLNLKGDADYKERGEDKLNDLMDESKFAKAFAGTKFNENYELVHKEFTKQFLNHYNIAHFSHLSLEDFNKEFKVHIDYEDVSRNPLSKDYDKAALKRFINGKNLKLTKELKRRLTKAGIDHKTSPSFRQWADKNIPASITKKIEKSLNTKNIKMTKGGGLDMRFKANQKLMSQIVKYKKTEKKKGKTKAPKPNVKRARNRTQSRVNLAAIGARHRKQKGSRVDKVVGQNPLALATLINRALPEVIASKMTSPALNYRTGRFSRSAEVKNVTVGPRGGTSIEYTYLKDPYQTFEPGNAQGSTFRDPRKIIGESIRQIAQGIVGDKFLTTRRV
mgnify:FL=1